MSDETSQSPLDAVKHHLAKAARCFHELLHSEHEIQRREWLGESYSLIFGVTISCFPTDTVKAARAKAIERVEPSRRHAPDAEETMQIMRAIIDELVPPQQEP